MTLVNYFCYVSELFYVSYLTFNEERYFVWIPHRLHKGILVKTLREILHCN